MTRLQISNDLNALFRSLKFADNFPRIHFLSRHLVHVVERILVGVVAVVADFGLNGFYLDVFSESVADDVGDVRICEIVDGHARHLLGDMRWNLNDISAVDGVCSSRSIGLT